MSGRTAQTKRDRVKAIIGVTAFHALLGYGLITGLGFQLPAQVKDSFKVFDVPREIPPPPVPEPPPPPEPKAKEPEGAASPPNIRSKPTPVVAPPPKVRLKTPPAVTTPKKVEAPPGDDPSAGSSSVAGPGTGSGGTGIGTGSGGAGTGSGGGGQGGLGTRAKRARGALAYSELPLPARARRAQGSVAVRYTVTAAGRVTGCTILRSSGDPDLDRSTCPQIERKFRYQPAQDATGRAVPDIVSLIFDWIPRS